MLDSGRAARVVGRSGSWVRLRLASGTEGWVRRDLLAATKSKNKKAPATASRSMKVAKKPVSKATKKKSVTVAAAPKAAKSVTTPPVSRHRFLRAAKLRPAPVSIPNGEVAEASVTSLDRIAISLADPQPKTQNIKVAAVASPQSRNSTRGAAIVRSALAYRGTPYRRGATGRGAFDCSGFTSFLFSKAGSPIPRTAAAQFHKGQPVSKANLQPGDLVFFKNTYKRGVSHVGIYAGNGSFVHASGAGRGVRQDSLSKAYYINHWAGARRPR